MSTSDYYDNHKNGFASSTITNGLNQSSDKDNNRSITDHHQSNAWKQENSGDWKYENEELWQTIEQTLNDKKSIIQDGGQINTDVKYRNLYSIPNYNNKIQFDNSNYTEMAGNVYDSKLIN